MRQRISTSMDEMIREKGDLLGVLEPFLKKLNVKSLREFAFGYMIGVLKVLGSSMITVREIHTGRMRPISNEDKLEIQEMIMEKLTEIQERIARELGR